VGDILVVLVADILHQFRVHHQRERLAELPSKASVTNRSATPVSAPQTYSYDTLNRLTAATESGSPGWAQNYGYDVVGNRWVTTNTNLPPLSLETPTSASWYTGSSVPNRINTWSYDAAGNVTQVGGMTRSFTYDAEDRQVSATINSNASSYGYDGLGQRVSKTTGGQTTVYVYDAFGNLDAEYSSQTPASPCGTPTCYLAQDHLGSTRLLTDANGSSTVERYDYLPFGGELLASTNGRTTGMGYFSSADTTNPKYTGQVRDPETFLDWYQVRFMSGAQGRFQSVDPANAGASPGNPQTWNAYAYVGNNPLSYTDPSGMAWYDVFIGIGEAIFNLITLGQGNQIWGGNTLPNIGGTNDGPWNEQPPISGGFGGPLNAGSVYGSGDAGPWINNVMPAETLGGPPQNSRGFGDEVWWLFKWVTGLSLPSEDYGPRTGESKDMRRSPRVQQARQQFIGAGCPSPFRFGQGHPDAYKESMKGFATGNPNWTQFQVGGYGGATISSSSGATAYRIPNTAGFSSFTGETTWGKYIGMKPNVWDNPLGATGPMHNVEQTFSWSEPSVCR
jgi:RHS repeat-associated protein